MSDDNAVVIGKGIRIKGSVKGGENIVVQGKIEGTVSLQKHHLTIEDAALMAGDVDVQNITVKGEHAGDTVCSEKVEMNASARVLGDLKTPRLVVADGARFKGKVEMTVDIPESLKLKVKR
jgi:cytoskeletal protein CcmA (bactofilin family)